MIFRTYSEQLNTIRDIRAVHEDVVQITIENKDRDFTASNLTTAVMSISSGGNASLIASVSGVVTDNQAVFTIDTADLNQYGDYEYQIYVDDSYTLATGVLCLAEKIQ